MWCAELQEASAGQHHGIQRQGSGGEVKVGSGHPRWSHPGSRTRHKEANTNGEKSHVGFDTCSSPSARPSLPRYLWSPDLSVIASADASLSTPWTAVCWILSQAVVGAKGREGVLQGDEFLFVCLFSQGPIAAAVRGGVLVGGGGVNDRGTEGRGG